MILTHHLALLGINKNAETKQYVDLVKLTKNNTDIVDANSAPKKQGDSQVVTPANPAGSTDTPEATESTDATDPVDPTDPKTSEGTGREEDSI